MLRQLNCPCRQPLFFPEKRYTMKSYSVICPACNSLIYSEVLKFASSAEPLPARKAGQPIKYKRVYKLQAFTQLGQSRISSFLPQDRMKLKHNLEMNWYCSTRCGIKAVRASATNCTTGKTKLSPSSKARTAGIRRV